MNQVTVEPLVSVIVPVYNAETYLDQCLKSIVGQTYRHLEIIVVDDGSTDASGSMCDRWAEQDERIHVIHQPNGGHSAARNTALDHMNGELVVMVDSDDVLHLDSTSTLIELLHQHDADIAVGAYVPFQDGEPEFPVQQGNGKQRLYNQQEALLAVFYQQGLTHSPWGRIFKASLFDDIRFPVGIIYEDLAIIYPLLQKCQRVVSTTRVLYGYRQHPNNSMKIYKSHRTDVLDVCERLEQETSRNDAQYVDAVRSRLLSAYFNILLLSQQDESDDRQELQDRCWKGIKRLRSRCLMDSNVRLKNKIGIIASLFGRQFLCNLIGRNYQPKP